MVESEGLRGRSLFWYSVTKSLNPEEESLAEPARSFASVGGLELLVLLLVRQEEGNAYAFSLQVGLFHSARRSLCLGTICKTLHRLEAKGFVVPQVEPPNGLEGRPRKRYGLTGAGLGTLEASLRGIFRCFKRTDRAWLLSLLPQDLGGTKVHSHPSP